MASRRAQVHAQRKGACGAAAGARARHAGGGQSMRRRALRAAAAGPRVGCARPVALALTRPPSPLPLLPPSSPANPAPAAADTATVKTAGCGAPRSASSCTSDAPAPAPAPAPTPPPAPAEALQPTNSDCTSPAPHAPGPCGEGSASRAVWGKAPHAGQQRTVERVYAPRACGGRARPRAPLPAPCHTRRRIPSAGCEQGAGSGRTTRGARAALLAPARALGLTCRHPTAAASSPPADSSPTTEPA